MYAFIFNAAKGSRLIINSNFVDFVENLSLANHFCQHVSLLKSIFLGSLFSPSALLSVKVFQHFVSQNSNVLVHLLKLLHFICPCFRFQYKISSLFQFLFRCLYLLFYFCDLSFVLRVNKKFFVDAHHFWGLLLNLLLQVRFAYDIPGIFPSLRVVVKFLPLYNFVLIRCLLV